MSSENMLIARVCHDLITPFNAINLGLEAFEMSSDMSLIENIKESTSKANAILKFTRELFSVKADTFCYSINSLKQLISDVLKYNNITFFLESDIDTIPNVAGKIIMYTATVAKEIMPFGGVVTTRLNDLSGEIITRCGGKNVSLPSVTFNGEVTHRNIIRHCLLEQLAQSGFELKTRQEGMDVIITEKMI
ncbi:hypothetical protein FACS189472_00930 [Alphaproteobacteria bacterium]|nr:hypothetical protein FACS1894126_6200 [Alphaproteobacteria bacterium]GHU16263.1 hypothetical protein FACS189472_00930 [Alphaproteobacteria bacterium]